MECGEGLVATDDSVLQRLRQYGESWLDEENYAELKKKSKQKMISHSVEKLESNSMDAEISRISRRQKKKLKSKHKKAKMEQCVINDEGGNTKPQQKTKKRKLQLEKMKAELGLGEMTQLDKVDDSGGNIKNTGSGRGPEVIVFTDPAKRRKPEKRIPVKPIGNMDTEAEDNPGIAEQPEMNLRDARFDVKMFGIKGFQSKDKESAIQDLLIKLGAKPPKRAHHNYKEYMEMRKKEIEVQKDRRELSRQFGSKGSKHSRGDKRHRSRDGIGYLDGQIGSYRSGVQLLKRDDIKRVKKSKVKK